MIPFAEASYKSQVYRLRALARKVVAHFGLRQARLEFINHGENATFKLTAADASKYLVRIHRGGYHSASGLKEELTWLDILSRTGLRVPRPVRSPRGRWLEMVTDPTVGERYCDVFR